jgi:DsbC/DsbD-like thiol-disulfide interchange protein
MPHPVCAISPRLRSLCRAAPLSLVLLLGAAGASQADDASPWDPDQRSALRLIAGSTGTGAPMLRAGIAMRIAPGWKTYWRYAGDSGLPPHFEFTGSENVKSVNVLWPVPRRFADGAGGNSIGYTGDVVFPLQIVPQDARRPVTLRVKAEYGVCEKVCIPASGKAQLQLKGGPSSEDTAITEAERRVPKPAALGDPGPLSVRALQRETIASRQRVIIDVTARGGGEVDLFAEGPTPQWSLPLPEPVESGPDGARRFAFDVEGVPPGASIAGAQIKLTLAAGNDAIEVTGHLD